MHVCTHARTHACTHTHTHARMYTHISGMLDNFFTHAIKMYLDKLSAEKVSGKSIAG